MSFMLQAHIVQFFAMPVLFDSKTIADAIEKQSTGKRSMYRKRRQGVPECYHFDGKHRPIIFPSIDDIKRRERYAQKTALKLSDKYTMAPSSVKITHARDRGVKVENGVVSTNPAGGCVG